MPNDQTIYLIGFGAVLVVFIATIAVYAARMRRGDVRRAFAARINGLILIPLIIAVTLVLALTDPTRWALSMFGA